MPHSIRSRRLVPLFVLLIGALWPVGSAVGNAPTSDEASDRIESDHEPPTEEKVWDHAVITKLADELAQTLREAYEQSLKAPPQETALQQRKRDATQGVIRRVRDLGEEYDRKLRAGYDRDASQPYFRAVVEEFEYMWDTADDAVPAEAAGPRIARLEQLLEEIRAAYDGP